MKLVDMDRGLVPYEGALERRRRRAMEAERRLAGGDDRRLAEGCCSYL